MVDGNSEDFIVQRLKITEDGKVSGSGSDGDGEFTI